MATSDFAKGMQDDITLYVTRDRLNNASFRQKLDPIAKNIFRMQNPLELVFKTFPLLTHKIQLLVLCYVNFTLVKNMLQVH